MESYHSFDFQLLLVQLVIVTNLCAFLNSLVFSSSTNNWPREGWGKKRFLTWYNQRKRIKHKQRCLHSLSLDLPNIDSKNKSVLGSVCDTPNLATVVHSPLKKQFWRGGWSSTMLGCFPPPYWRGPLVGSRPNDGLSDAFLQLSLFGCYTVNKLNIMRIIDTIWLKEGTSPNKAANIGLGSFPSANEREPRTFSLTKPSSELIICY